MSDPRTTLPSARTTPRFAGIATFCRFPLLEQVAPGSRPVDWALLGVPFDGGVTYRPGARFGPRAVRAESQYVKPYHMGHGVMLSEVLSLADAGDAPVKPYECEANTACVADFAATLADPAHTRLLAIGGDHSIALAMLRAAGRRPACPKGGGGGGGAAGPLAVIHFDSHLDTVDSVWDERHGHASPFIRAVEEGLIDPTRMLSIGIKGPLNTPKDLEYARDHGVTIVTYDDVKQRGLGAIDAFMKRLGDAAAYLSFDIDVVDPAFAPGTGTPSVGGFTSAEALGLLRHLAGAGPAPPNIVGADVVEVLPDRDVAGITALLAAHVAFEILCLDGVRRR